MSRVLVTGATGFIGKHLVARLVTTGYSVITVTSQSGDMAAAYTWATLPKAETVIHLAAKTFVPDSWANPAAFIGCNLLGTVGALDYCKANQAKLIFLSSYLYGNPKTVPIPETACLIAANPYALSKKLAEEACEFYATKFGMSIIILRPFNVYGPGQAGHFLIPSIVNQARLNDAIRVKDLAPRRDYVFIGDLVEAIVKAVEQGEGFNILNIGSGVSHSVAEVIKIIQDLQGTDLPVHSSNERRQDEVMETVADITRATQVLGWSPKYGIVEGLKEVLITEAKTTTERIS